MRFANSVRLLLTMVVLAHCLPSGLGIVSGQTPSTSMSVETLKTRGLELKQNLVLGNYHLALQDLVHMQLVLAGSPKAYQAATRADGVAKRSPTASELEPSLTAPLVPLADKLLLSIDGNNAVDLGEQIQQLIIKTGGIFKELHRRDKVDLSGTQLGAYFDLEERLKLSLQSNDVAKSVDLAMELQSMMDDMRAGGESVGHLVGNVYLVNDALGRDAFFRRDYKTANEYLMKAVSFPPGTIPAGTICCWGPSLWLAKSLLAVGYRDDVLRFLQTCRQSVWILDTEKLDQWILELQSGKNPTLQPNAGLDF
jgi:hypothetical protein